MVNLDELAVCQNEVGAIYERRSQPDSPLNNLETMEFTHTYKSKVAFTRPQTSFQHILLTFINKHAGVFEALTRGGTPYGGNWLPVNPQPAKAKSTVPKEQLAGIQRQLNELNQTLTQLSDQLSTQNVSVRTTDKQSGVPEEIGINRFRALQDKS